MGPGNVPLTPKMVAENYTYPGLKDQLLAAVGKELKK